MNIYPFRFFSTKAYVYTNIHTHVYFLYYILEISRENKTDSNQLCCSAYSTTKDLLKPITSFHPIVIIPWYRPLTLLLDCWSITLTNRSSLSILLVQENSKTQIWLYRFLLKSLNGYPCSQDKVKIPCHSIQRLSWLGHGLSLQHHFCHSQLSLYGPVILNYKCIMCSLYFRPFHLMLLSSWNIQSLPPHHF